MKNNTETRLPEHLDHELRTFYSEQYRALLLGIEAIRQMSECSIYKPRQRDEDGEPIRTPLGDGLARDAFHALHDYAARVGALPERI